MKIKAMVAAIVFSLSVSAYASKQDEAGKNVCEKMGEVAFVVMNGRQNLVKKEIFLNHQSTTKDVAKIIERAYNEPEVEVHEIAFAVRDFAKAEENRCLSKSAI